MSTDNIEAARAAFAEFEQDMTESGAVGALREGLDYALDIEAAHSDAKSKQVARNLINSYRRQLIERISSVLNDAGSFEDDYYWRWVSLANVFEKAGYDEDKRLSQLKLRLWEKAIRTWSKDDRSALLRGLQRDLDGK